MPRDLPMNEQAALADYVRNRGVTHCRPAKASSTAFNYPDRLVEQVLERMEGIVRSWFVLAVGPGMDKRVHDRLRKSSIDVWMPECRIRRRATRRSPMEIGATEPVFPGYLLVRLDLERDQWWRLEAVEGAERILRRQGGLVPASVPGALIEALQREIELSGGVLVIDKGHMRWRRGANDGRVKKGDTVRLLDGPFSGWVGVCEEAEPDRRVKILLDIFGGSRAVVVSEALVEPT
jgi:transcription antitermination factor NusG